MPLQNFNFDELFSKFRVPILVLLVGLILTACGVIFFKNGLSNTSTNVEVLNGTTESQDSSEITVEIAGQVEKPGVYKMSSDSRVEDLLIISGGFSGLADRVWADKYLNRAGKIADGQKIYVPKVGESSNQQTLGSSANNGVGDQTTSSSFSPQNGGLVNINTSSLKELDSLPGIGQTYAQNIIDHRPYSTLEELVSKGAIKQSLFDKIKDKVTIY